MEKMKKKACKAQKRRKKAKKNMEKKQNKKMNKQKKKKTKSNEKKKLVAWENYSIFPTFFRVLVNYLFFSLNIK
jgi:hypothetical protein